MSKENIIITGKTIEDVVRSANQTIQTLVNKINLLEAKLSNVKGESNKIQNNVVRVVSNKEQTALEVVTSNGKFAINLARKE